MQSSVEPIKLVTNWTDLPKKPSKTDQLLVCQCGNCANHTAILTASPGRAFAVPHTRRDARYALLGPKQEAL